MQKKVRPRLSPGEQNRLAGSILRVSPPDLEASRMNTLNLHGRTVVVPGAGSGIGREKGLLAARCGADLAICDVTPSGLAEVVERNRSVAPVAAEAYGMKRLSPRLAGWTARRIAAASE